MTDGYTIGAARIATLALTALLLGSGSGIAQDAVRGDSATIAATGHGRLELEVRRTPASDTGHGGVRVALDARIAARVGMAAGAATIAVLLGAGGLASRRRQREGDAAR